MILPERFANAWRPAFVTSSQTPWRSISSRSRPSFARCPTPCPLWPPKVESQRALVSADADAYRLADMRFRAGLDSYLPTLTAQLLLYSARQQLITLRQADLTNEVTLYEALGGGLEAAYGSRAPLSRITRLFQCASNRKRRPVQLPHSRTISPRRHSPALSQGGAPALPDHCFGPKTRVWPEPPYIKESPT